MYESLIDKEPMAYLCIFCMDKISEEVLSSLNLERASIIGLQDFENERLLAVKPSRNRGEYCWTCKPTAIKYVLQKFNAQSCTYLDADLYFFSSPIVIQRELEKGCAVITPHDYTKKYDTSILNGIYCAQFIGFNNNAEGINALNWWENACLDWCYGRHEDGKYGDQKYLEDLAKLPLTIITREKGVLGPWNINNYQYKKIGNTIKGYDPKNASEFNVIFFHYHAMAFDRGYKNINLGYYDVPQAAPELIYARIARHLLKMNLTLERDHKIISIDNTMRKVSPLKAVYHYMRRLIINKPLIIKTRKLLLDLD
jgi:hypothetical protein